MKKIIRMLKEEHIHCHLSFNFYSLIKLLQCKESYIPFNTISPFRTRKLLDKRMEQKYFLMYLINERREKKEKTTNICRMLR